MRFRSEPVRQALSRAFMLLVLADAAATLADEPPVVEFKPSAGAIAIFVGDQPFARYVYDDPTVGRPYLADLRSPAGATVTRAYPPRPGDPADHATMHPGLWLSFGDLSGHDFWRHQARVEQTGEAELRSGAGSGSLQVRNRYLTRDGELVCEEQCRLTVHVTPAGYLLDWLSTFQSEDTEFHFGDQEEMGLGVRVAPELAVAFGANGDILDSVGRKNEEQIWGKSALWCDYSGQLDGRSVGVAIMPDPNNFRPCWWQVRNYGLMVANPFGRQALTGGEPSRISVTEGKPFQLRFGILVHDELQDRAQALERAHQEYLGLRK